MFRTLAASFVCALALVAAAAPAGAQDIVLRTSDAKTVQGNWSTASAASAADGQYLSSPDEGSSNTDAPLAQPNDYVEFTFDAPANTPYHVWFRLRAAGNSKYSDSVWVQYSDALNASGSAVYRIGTTSALNVNLERCSGCGVSGWGWQDDAYWLSQTTTVRFAGGGTHTIRVQAREDGVQIDQVVLSASSYLFASPGSATNDTTIVPKSGAETATSGAYLGSPVTLPGHVKAENFDSGPDGVAYHDSTSGNSGGLYRQTNVDIEKSSSGGYDIGWTAAGEWLNYSVSVPSAGSYTVQLRVASQGGGTMHVGFNEGSNVWKSVSIPSTGGWQNWTTVNVPVTLAAGSPLLTVMFDTGGVNLDYIDVVSGSAPAPSPTPTSTSSGGGGGVTVVTWNIKVNDSGSSHAQGAMDRVMDMSPQPQVVVIQEARRTQYSTYVNELQARSGRSWQGVFENHCPPGAWTGSSCSSSEDEGVAIFTSLPVIDSGRTYLGYADQYHSARALVRLAVSVNGIPLQVFGTHLQLSASARQSSMSYIKSYGSNYSRPQLLAGDLNADMDQIDTTSGLLPNFVDSWKLVGSGNGFTASAPSPTMKLDYWLADAGGRAKPNWTVVVTATGSYSDHFPVIANYSIQ